MESFLFPLRIFAIFKQTLFDNIDSRNFILINFSHTFQKFPQRSQQNQTGTLSRPGEENMKTKMTT